MISRIDLKTGFRCNNRCRFCVQGEKRFELPEKSAEDLKRLLEEGRREADAVVFTGGEVTIRRDLPELVAFARGLGFRTIQLQTNGRMLSSLEVLRRLVEAGVTEVSPAIHGPNAEIHDGLTRVPGSFRQTVRGAFNATQLGVPVLINSVITRTNYRHLPEMARLFVALEVRQFQLAMVHPLGSAAAEFDAVVPRLSEVSPYARAALQIGIDAGIPCMTEAIPLCFLRGYEGHAAEWIIPRTRIYEADWVVEDYTALRLQEGKLQGEPCLRCRHQPDCEGPWREYPERWGWEEFKPTPHA